LLIADQQCKPLLKYSESLNTEQNDIARPSVGKSKIEDYQNKSYFDYQNTNYGCRSVLKAEH
jgi:hypothetical protein